MLLPLFLNKNIYEWTENFLLVSPSPPAADRCRPPVAIDRSCWLFFPSARSKRKAALLQLFCLLSVKEAEEEKTPNITGRTNNFLWAFFLKKNENNHVYVTLQQEKRIYIFVVRLPVTRQRSRSLEIFPTASALCYLPEKNSSRGGGGGHIFVNVK